MFFVVSKIFWLIAQPLNAATLLLIAAIILWLLRRRRSAQALVVLAAAVLVISTWTTLGALLLRPLEDRFPRPEAPQAVAGIIVLGGGTDGATSQARGGYQLNDAGERLVETAVLARRYPDARIVLTGGLGALLADGETDAVTGARMLTALGVDPGRMVLETQSRNTYENAVMTEALVKPAAGETWLLVTSAFHMPRSVGLFRKAGFDVVPWPVDYRTTGREGLGLFRDESGTALAELSLALREWTGLVAYRLTGKIDSVLPGPAS